MRDSKGLVEIPYDLKQELKAFCEKYCLTITGYATHLIREGIKPLPPKRSL